VRDREEVLLVREPMSSSFTRLPTAEGYGSG
jgi:hypothetical protein